MIRWWGVTGHEKTPIAETDLRVGGHFRVQFWTPNGEHQSVSGEDGRCREQEEFGSDSWSGMHGRGGNGDDAGDGKVRRDASGDRAAHRMASENSAFGNDGFARR